MLSNDLLEIKNKLNINIDDEILLHILFDINRYFDKKLTKIIQQQQKYNQRVFNSIERKILRNYYYHKNDNLIKELNITSFPSIDYDKTDIKNVISSTQERLKIYEEDKILNSIKERYNNLIQHQKTSTSHMQEWLDYYNKKRDMLFNYSSFFLRIDNKDFLCHKSNETYLYDIIKKTYNKLENYRYFVIIIDGQLYDNENNDITWQIAYKLTLYSENFVQYKGKYFPCKKEQLTKELNNFIKERFNNYTDDFASEFYKNISTGFKFEDCFVTENQNQIIITLKKIALDESPIPCPSCFTTIQSGNSYPEMFLRSYECKNPNCPDRSKSGRGKRFDEYGVYRVYKLEENNEHNIISSNMYNNWRRDILVSNQNYMDMLIKYYTWNNEKILIYNIKNIDNTHCRIIKQYDNKDYVNDNFSNYIDSYDNLPLVVLFKKISQLFNKKTFGLKTLSKQIEIINGDSTMCLNELDKNIIGTAITSPPYYNAREYSQWSTMILYLIDMMRNAKAVFDCLDSNGKYLYNIGDIVCEDNVYVKSHMSNRRLPLGFLSCMIFELVGYKLKENIIWDKGEVQSKRNSTINLFSGYVKTINCYEHIFVFSKSNNGINNRKIEKFSPVIKINSKGENTYKHTAPYPEELVALVKPYLIDEKYLLDPFLGSGTTLKWCVHNNIKGVGIELNKEYFELAKIYVSQEQQKRDN
ncbi:MAG: DNA methyltransferase [Christensenellales bacterium]